MDQTRRGFLGAAGAAATTSLAGCVGALRTLGGAPDDPPAETADWQFRGSPQRRGVYPDRSVPDAVRVDWRLGDVNTGDHTAAKASPVPTPGGDVIVPGDDGDLTRVTPDGDVVWTASTEATSGRGIHGTPAIANGAVYVGAYDGATYAVDLASGERYWRTQVGDAIGSSPGYLDGTVYIAVEYYDPSGAMFALDAVTGEVEWDDQRVTNHPHSTAAIDPAADRIVVGANDGDLYGWSHSDREFQWRFETSDPIKGPVATYDGGAVFGSWDDRIYRVVLDDGTEEWSFEADRSVMSGPSVDPETGTVYVGAHDSRLYALDADSGAEQWSFDTGGSIIGCPTVTADHVLVGSYDEHLYAVDRETGAEAWSVAADGIVTSTPLVTEDAVYFATRATEAYLEDGSGPSGGLYRVVADE
ncbi:PQQ-binding-like beta-propeller repeat protein [Halomicrobium salinisoli]|uniref:outer membrane protein assembly factor BamB family protein n=1 Tax=Halomicrobium salinisoli TaxID=2878391 RepID=UPI001CF00DAB|nr:PQQ-binding-like beta-propeller repeat protein [Halomicrobium salinisoli]